MTGVIAPLGVRHGWVGMFRGLLGVLASLRETWVVGMFRGPWIESQPWNGWCLADCMCQIV
jgi:hypothetical protein